MARNISDAKNYNSSYLYGNYEYSKLIGQAIMSAERINKNEENFEDVRIVTKRRQTTAVLINVLESPNVILLKPNSPLPAAFRVFVAKDNRVDNKVRVFIDISEIIELKDGFWVCKNADVFIAQLVAAMTHLIYYVDPSKIYTNAKLTLHGTENFVKLFGYIFDYLRISGYSENKERIQYIVALYYQCGVLWKDLNENARNVAMKVSGIDKRHADIAEMFLKGEPEKAFVDINAFIKALAVNFKLEGLTLEIFIDKWMYLYGAGYQFAVDIPPAYFKMITDTYSGMYLTKQRTLDKICGKGIIEITTDLFEIGKSIAGR